MLTGISGSKTFDERLEDLRHERRARVRVVHHACGLLRPGFSAPAWTLAGLGHRGRLAAG